MSTLLIFGTRSTAIEIFEVAKFELKNKFSKIFLVSENVNDLNSKHECILDEDLDNFKGKEDVFYILSFTEQKLRKKMIEISKNLKFKPVNVIHPLSIISKSSKIGLGNYIAAGSVLSSNCIVSDHCIINFNATVGHDSIINDHCILNPGARISGNVKVGKRVLVGANSLIFQGISIDDDCLIDALTYIDRDIEKRMICSSKHLKIFKRVI